MHEFKSDVSYRITDLCEETNNLRVHWQKQTADVVEQLQEFDATAQKQTAESRAQAQQRANDLETMEQALSTVQKQQLQVRANLEDHVQTMTSQTALVLKKLEFLESQTNVHKSAIEQAKQKSASMEKEQRRRMENISKMFTVRKRTVADMAEPHAVVFAIDNALGLLFPPNGRCLPRP
jgi:hypothetical protein